MEKSPAEIEAEQYHEKVLSYCKNYDITLDLLGFKDEDFFFNIKEKLISMMRNDDNFFKLFQPEIKKMLYENLPIISTP
jgi:hypothetical protein